MDHTGQYGYPPPGAAGYAQSSQQYQYGYQQSSAPIQNPFGNAPPAPRTAYNGGDPSYDPEYQVQLAQWQSAYAPQEEQDRNRRREKFERNTGGGGGGGNPNLAPLGVKSQPTPAVPEPSEAKPAKDSDKKVTVVRKGGGQTWEDSSLLEWDPTQFRIMVGNLAGEVTDESLAKAFEKYGVSKARVVRDKRSTKSKGFGFVSFTDGEQGFKAAREMVGKYIGSHPVTIQRSKTDLRPVTQKNDKYKGKNNRRDKDKKDKKGEDPLRANTGAHIEKKAVMRNPAGMKVLG